MCRIEKCERHEFNNGLCLPHLKNPDAPVRKKRQPKKKEEVEIQEVTEEA